MSAPSEFFHGLSLFTGPEHMPFRWEGGKPAAVLVHGFPGTPADVRPLAASLHAAGWTVSAPLLPGFGPALGTLAERRYTEWVDAVAGHVASLKRDHAPVIVLGHSMGGAVSLLASAQEPVDGQVLVAPYWRFGHALQHLLWPVIRPLARRWRPLHKADFQSQQVRKALLRMFPDLDLDDPRAQDELRRFVVPLRLLDELRCLGVAAYRTAHSSQALTLVVQGLRDRLVRPGATSKLFLRLRNPAGIELVDGTHNVLKPEDSAWDRVEAAVLRFAESLVVPSKTVGRLIVA